MKLGNQQGCLFDDRIDIELSPSNVERLLHILENEAMDASNYLRQGFMRDLKDYFQRRHDEWRRLRDEKDKKGK
ncbi:MAG: hypothetical protein KAV87_17940 [Desulfobacteraceae bacterium]|nr:hypothetical protein [Desulfobacteraceae bacterium]